MTFCDLPDSLDMAEGDWDPDIKEQVLKAAETRTRQTDQIKHPNPGRAGDVKRATGPKIVHVRVYREPTVHMKQTWEEVNAETCALPSWMWRARGSLWSLKQALLSPGPLARAPLSTIPHYRSGNWPCIRIRRKSLKFFNVGCKLSSFRKVPQEVAQRLAGANLCALNKKSGGIRPIV